MKVAFADPPYIGQAAKHYAAHPDYAGEVDHSRLVWEMLHDYDAWVLCLSSVTLGRVLKILREQGLREEEGHFRVGAWFKPFASFKPNVNPAFAWEPVIFRGGRKRGRDVPTLRDWVSVPITLKRGCAGAKPETFCFWCFEFLGMEPGDELHDLFPGSGAVSQAWEKWRTTGRLFLEEKAVCDAL